MGQFHLPSHSWPQFPAPRTRKMLLLPYSAKVKPTAPASKPNGEIWWLLFIVEFLLITRVHRLFLASFSTTFACSFAPFFTWVSSLHCGPRGALNFSLLVKPGYCWWTSGLALRLWTVNVSSLPGRVRVQSSRVGEAGIPSMCSTLEHVVGVGLL